MIKITRIEHPCLESRQLTYSINGEMVNTIVQATDVKKCMVITANCLETILDFIGDDLTRAIEETMKTVYSHYSSFNIPDYSAWRKAFYARKKVFLDIDDLKSPYSKALRVWQYNHAQNIPCQLVETSSQIADLTKDYKKCASLLIELIKKIRNHEINRDQSLCA